MSRKLHGNDYIAYVLLTIAGAGNAGTSEFVITPRGGHPHHRMKRSLFDRGYLQRSGDGHVITAAGAAYLNQLLEGGGEGVEPYAHEPVEPPDPTPMSFHPMPGESANDPTAARDYDSVVIGVIRLRRMRWQARRWRDAA